MAVTLTDAEAEHTATVLRRPGSGLGLRLGTRKSGCSAYAYLVGYTDEARDREQVFVCRGVLILLDRNSPARIDGMEVDFLKAGLRYQGLEFHNPNVTNSCGCGESIAIRP